MIEIEPHSGEQWSIPYIIITKSDILRYRWSDLKRVLAFVL